MFLNTVYTSNNVEATFDFVEATFNFAAKKKTATMCHEFIEKFCPFDTVECLFIYFKTIAPSSPATM